MISAYYLGVPLHHIHSAIRVIRAGLAVTEVNAELRSVLERWCEYESKANIPLYMRRCDGCGGKIMLGQPRNNGWQEIKYSCTCNGDEPLQAPEWTPIGQTEDDKAYAG